jgi:hypothetical protein
MARSAAEFGALPDAQFGHRITARRVARNGASTTRSAGPIRAFPDAWYRTSANGCRRAGERHFEGARTGRPPRVSGRAIRHRVAIADGLRVRHVEDTVGTEDSRIVGVTFPDIASGRLRAPLRHVIVPSTVEVRAFEAGCTFRERPSALMVGREHGDVTRLDVGEHVNCGQQVLAPCVREAGQVRRVAFDPCME